MSDVEKVDDMNEFTVSSKVLSRMLGIGDRRIRQLAEEGIVVKAAHGRYKLQDSIHNYILNLKVSNSTKVFDANLNDELDFEKEKALHERIKTQMAELKLALMKGDVYRSSDVESVMYNMLANFKSKCLALPSKLAPKLINRAEKSYINEVLADEISNILNELSEFSPSLFYGEEYIATEDEEDEDLVDLVNENYIPMVTDDGD